MSIRIYVTVLGLLGIFLSSSWASSAPLSLELIKAGLGKALPLANKVKTNCVTELPDDLQYLREPFSEICAVVEKIGKMFENSDEGVTRVLAANFRHSTHCRTIRTHLEFIESEVVSNPTIRSYPAYVNICKINKDLGGIDPFFGS